MLLNHVPHLPTSPISTVTSWPKQRTATTASSLAFCLFSCPYSVHSPHRVPVPPMKQPLPSSPSHRPSYLPVASTKPEMPSSLCLFVCSLFLSLKGRLRLVSCCTVSAWDCLAHCKPLPWKNEGLAHPTSTSHWYCAAAPPSLCSHFQTVNRPPPSWSFPSELGLP